LPVVPQPVATIGTPTNLALGGTKMALVAPIYDGIDTSGGGMLLPTTTGGTALTAKQISILNNVDQNAVALLVQQISAGAWIAALGTAATIAAGLGVPVWVMLAALVAAGLISAAVVIKMKSVNKTAKIVKSGGHKRYSIGANPRMRTLLKVAKRVDNIFISYDRRMNKFRSRIRGSYRPQRISYRRPLMIAAPHRR